MKKQKYFQPAALTIACILVTSSLHAAEPETTTADAEATTDVAANTDIAQGLFDEAINRRDAGDVFQSIRLFELLTQVQPDLGRARLELAVAYHQANRYQDAIRELKTVLANEDTPDNVRLSILAYLGQVQNDEKQPDGKHQFSYYLKAGVVNNSNLNASQAVATGLTTTSNARISSLGTDLTANASHRYSRNELFDIAGTAASVQWQSQATVNSKLYTEDSSFNLNTLSLSTGPAFISPGRWRASVIMQADYIQLGSDLLATFVSLSPTITFDLGNFRSVLVESAFTTHEYKESANAGYDGSSFMVGAGYTTFLPEHGAGIETGIRLTRDNSDSDAFSHDLIELYLAAFYAIDAQLNSYARFNSFSYQYDAQDPTVLVTRDESELHLSLGLNYDFKDGTLKDWAMNVELALIDSDSNADSLDYKRSLLSANLSRYFQ